MKIQKLILLFFFVFCFKLSLCQIWPKTYLPGDGTSPLSVTGSYDKGYFIGGWFISSDGFPINGLLIKTDLNGEMLWYKTFGDYNDGTGVNDVKQTNDNGLIVSGVTKKTDSWGDPFIMKLNKCGESEWCRIYSVGQNRVDVALSIEQVRFIQLDRIGPMSLCQLNKFRMVISLIFFMDMICHQIIKYIF